MVIRHRETNRIVAFGRVKGESATRESKASISTQIRFERTFRTSAKGMVGTFSLPVSATRVELVAPVRYSLGNETHCLAAWADAGI